MIAALVVAMFAASTTWLTWPVAAARSLSDPTTFPVFIDGVAGDQSIQEKTVAAFGRTALVGPDRGLVVANLSIEPGRYLVTYGFESRMIAAHADIELSCGLVDANGVVRFLIPDPTPISTGTGWRQHLVTSPFSLPEVTIGIRCVSDRTHVVYAQFRGVSISVIRRPEG